MHSSRTSQHRLCVLPFLHQWLGVRLELAIASLGVLSLTPTGYGPWACTWRLAVASLGVLSLTLWALQGSPRRSLPRPLDGMPWRRASRTTS